MKEDKNLDKFIKQNIDIEKPSFDFSKEVMQHILTSDLNKEKALTNLLKKHTLENPNVDFTSNIISVINQYSKESNYTPVIGKKVWILIISFIVILMGYTISKLDVTQTYSTWLDKYIPSFNVDISFNLPLILTSPLFALSIFALSSLLLLDYFIRNRKVNLNL